MPPDIILKRGTILVSQSGSGLGIEMQSQGFLFGYVELVNDLSDSTAIGDTVVYKQQDVIVQFKYGSTIYFVLYENENIFKEGPLL